MLARRTLVLLFLSFFLVVPLRVAPAIADPPPRSWTFEWTRTDFTRTSVPFAEIPSGGPPKDGIPSIDAPRFVAIADAPALADNEPVIGFINGGDARAYPLRILTWHEIVNDVGGGRPVAVTYCPLCNAAIVFDRSVDGRTRSFGTTGKLRKSDLVMYDRETESWWQQFSGEAIVGAETGKRLVALPARLESWARFKARAPEGKVLVPNDPDARPYGTNPYVGYDSAAAPFLYDGAMPAGIAPLAYVVVVGKEAWALELLRKRGRIETGARVIEWQPGKSSALDAHRIAEGRDIGNVVVRRRTADGLADAVHDVTFAFVFHAFVPDGTIHRAE
ncbi:MAG: DUF3179 domain-containing protein [Alphaproteobacteria bacterium]|nr:DUF3179 domain-containing protein [Alphaproteobacteria bacterium]